VETLLAHRDGPGGLFIGASMLLFALMNSAPAELLHPLKCSASANLVTPASHKRWRVTKKNAGNYAGAGILWVKTKPFFKEKAALTDKIGKSGANR